MNYRLSLTSALKVFQQQNGPKDLGSKPKETRFDYFSRDVGDDKDPSDLFFVKMHPEEVEKEVQSIMKRLEEKHKNQV